MGGLFSKIINVLFGGIIMLSLASSDCRKAERKRHEIKLENMVAQTNQTDIRQSFPYPTVTSSTVYNRDFSSFTNQGDIRGFYISSDILRYPGFVECLIKDATEVGFNTVVVDLKDSYSKILCKTGLTNIENMDQEYDILSPENFNNMCNTNGIKQVIYRIVVLNDKKLSRRYPYVFKGQTNYPWVDPERDDVVRHYSDLLSSISKMGVKTAQLDYIRYADSEGVFNTEESRRRTDKLTSFLSNISLLKPEGMDIDGDFFGRTAYLSYRNGKDATGQDIKRQQPYVRKKCFMAYPSHCETNISPKPYEAVKMIIDSAKQLIDISEIVPYLQAFAFKIPETMSYEEYIKQQLAAVYDSGAKNFIFWNPNGDYETLFKVMGDSKMPKRPIKRLDVVLKDKN